MRYLILHIQIQDVILSFKIIGRKQHGPNYSMLAFSFKYLKSLTVTCRMHFDRSLWISWCKFSVIWIIAIREMGLDQGQQNFHSVQVSRQLQLSLSLVRTKNTKIGNYFSKRHQQGLVTGKYTDNLEATGATTGCNVMSKCFQMRHIKVKTEKGMK